MFEQGNPTLYRFPISETVSTINNGVLSTGEFVKGPINYQEIEIGGGFQSCIGAYGYRLCPTHLYVSTHVQYKSAYF